LTARTWILGKSWRDSRSVDMFFSLFTGGG
jgi:hypothetical protein